MSEDKVKRKKTNVSLEIKVKALQCIENGESCATVAKKSGVTVSTVRHWRKNSESLKNWDEKYKDVGCTSKRRSRMRDPVNKALDELIWNWFKQQRSLGSGPVNGPMIQAKALEFNESLGGSSSFKASDGWLSKWKDRHGVQLTTICGEKLPSDNEAGYVDTFLKVELKEQDTLDQTVDCNVETGLSNKILLSEALPLSIVKKEAPESLEDKENNNEECWKQDSESESTTFSEVTEEPKMTGTEAIYQLRRVKRFCERDMRSYITAEEILVLDRVRDRIALYSAKDDCTKK